jgi:hypothetical protein
MMVVLSWKQVKRESIVLIYLQPLTFKQPLSKTKSCPWVELEKASQDFPPKKEIRKQFNNQWCYGIENFFFIYWKMFGMHVCIIYRLVLIEIYFNSLETLEFFLENIHLC